VTVCMDYYGKGVLVLPELGSYTDSGPKTRPDSLPVLARTVSSEVLVVGEVDVMVMVAFSK
jgi:hypothetical protein